MYVKRTREFGLSPEDQMFMRVYEQAHKEDINYDLIVELVKKCHENYYEGMVLYYLNPYGQPP